MRFRPLKTVLVSICCGWCLMCTRSTWPSGATPGQSDVIAGPQAAAATTDNPPANTESPSLADKVRHWRAVRPRFVSDGHPLPGVWSEVRANPGAAKRYLSSEIEADYPRGAALALVSYDETGAAVAVAMMERASNGWRYQATNPPDAPPVDLVRCARCHEMAPRDATFGLPNNQQAP